MVNFCFYLMASHVLMYSYFMIQDSALEEKSYVTAADVHLFR